MQSGDSNSAAHRDSAVIVALRAFESDVEHACLPACGVASRRRPHAWECTPEATWWCAQIMLAAPSCMDIAQKADRNITAGVFAGAGAGTVRGGRPGIRQAEPRRPRRYPSTNSYQDAIPYPHIRSGCDVRQRLQRLRKQRHWQPHIGSIGPDCCAKCISQQQQQQQRHPHEIADGCAECVRQSGPRRMESADNAGGREVRAAARGQGPPRRGTPGFRPADSQLPSHASYSAHLLCVAIGTMSSPGLCNQLPHQH